MKKISLFPKREKRRFKQLFLLFLFITLICHQVFCQKNDTLTTFLYNATDEPEVRVITSTLYYKAAFEDSLHTLDMYIEKDIKPIIKQKQRESADPLTKSYPELTPYQFASNTPIQAIDFDGLEKRYYLTGLVKGIIKAAIQSIGYEDLRSAQYEDVVIKNLSPTGKETGANGIVNIINKDYMMVREESFDDGWFGLGSTKPSEYGVVRQAAFKDEYLIKEMTNSEGVVLDYMHFIFVEGEVYKETKAQIEIYQHSEGNISFNMSETVLKEAAAKLEVTVPVLKQAIDASLKAHASKGSQSDDYNIKTKETIKRNIKLEFNKIYLDVFYKEKGTIEPKQAKTTQPNGKEGSPFVGFTVSVIDS